MPTSVELVRAIYADWERGDFSSSGWAHPEFEAASVGGPEHAGTSGVAETGRAWREYLGQWEDYRVTAEEYREVDADTVLVFNRITGRGRTSGVEIGDTASRPANLFHMRDGLVLKMVLYWDRRRALHDLGLEA
jgi:ketosteroid isomerase-like protein